jgi:hypothetical protein
MVAKKALKFIKVQWGRGRGGAGRGGAGRGGAGRGGAGRGGAGRGGGGGLAVGGGGADTCKAWVAQLVQNKSCSTTS